MSETIVRHLLKDIFFISRKYEQVEQLSGDRFNIFKILKIEANEVRLHSSIVAELLNPKGSHGFGHIFLKLFLECLSLDGFKPEQSEVVVEKHIGLVTDTRGGRIDIYLKDSTGNMIFIENKIYAADQINQLERYHNYNKNAKILYLSLDGKLPSINSVSSDSSLHEKGLLRVISYSHDIIRWLERCRKEATTQPMLRETLSQYINIIKYLTNQSQNKIMENEIKQVILADINNFKSAQLAASLYSSIVSDIISRTTVDLEQQYQSSHLHKDVLNWKGYILCMYVGKDGDGFHFGVISTKEGKRNVCRDPDMAFVFNLMNEVGTGYKNGDWFVGWKYPSMVRKKDLETAEIYQLYEDDSRANFCNAIIEEASAEWEKIKSALTAYQNNTK